MNEETVIRKDGVQFSIGDHVAHVQDYRIRSGKVIEVIQNWSGCRAIGRKTDRLWITTPRVRVSWDSPPEWAKATWVDAANVVHVEEGMTIRCGHHSYGEEFAEIKRRLRDGMGGYRVDQEVSIRRKPSYVAGELRRITKESDVIAWEDREKAEAWDLIEYEGDGVRLLMAVVESGVVGTILRPEDV